jgi:hypothetical protein
LSLRSNLGLKLANAFGVFQTDNGPRLAQEAQDPVIAKKTLVQVKSIGDKRRLLR